MALEIGTLADAHSWWSLGLVGVDRERDDPVLLGEGVSADAELEEEEAGEAGAFEGVGADGGGEHGGVGIAVEA